MTPTLTFVATPPQALICNDRDYAQQDYEHELDSSIPEVILRFENIASAKVEFPQPSRDLIVDEGVAQDSVEVDQLGLVRQVSLTMATIQGEQLPSTTLRFKVVLREPDPTPISSGEGPS